MSGHTIRKPKQARVECDRCGKKITLLADDVIPQHGWTRNQVFHHCDDSGKRYAHHMCSFFCANTPERPWVAQCRCGGVWMDDDYRVVEGLWREHIKTQDPDGEAGAA